MKVVLDDLKRGQTADHQADHDLVDKVLRGFGEGFKIAPHPSGFPQPGEGALHDPAALEHHEANGFLDDGCRLPLLDLDPNVARPGVLDDLQSRTHDLLDRSDQLSAVACIRPDVLQLWEDVPYLVKQQDRASTVLEVRPVHHDTYHQTQRIDQHVTLAAADLPPAVVPSRTTGLGGPYGLAINDRWTRRRITTQSRANSFSQK